MAAIVPTKTPRFFHRGDTVKWREPWPDYPPPTWTLTVELVQATDHQKITATDNGDGSHLVTVTTAISADMDPGLYRYQIKVTDGAEVFTLEQGTIDVRQNYAATTEGFDDRTHAQKVLDAVEALIEGKATRDQASLAEGGRSLSRYTFEEWTALRDKYRWEVQREADAERIAQGLAPRTRQTVRFVRP